jgi:hypothetical protein
MGRSHDEFWDRMTLAQLVALAEVEIDVRSDKGRRRKRAAAEQGTAADLMMFARIPVRSG